MRKIGYAAINTSLYPEKYRSIRLRTVKEKGVESLKEIIVHNLVHLLKVLNWNIKNDIYFYRFPSSLLPLTNHPDILQDFSWRWYKDEDVLEKIEEIKAFVRLNGIRLTTHPDQFIVLNSPREDVVESSVITLNELALILEKLGGSDMIIHVGGVYGDKGNAMKRFIETVNHISKRTYSYLRVENDDKSYNVFEVLEISKSTGLPVILDVHHHRCLLSEPLDDQIINQVIKSWNGLVPKLHVSTGKESLNDRRHAEYIAEDDIK